MQDLQQQVAEEAELEGRSPSTHTPATSTPAIGRRTEPFRRRGTTSNGGFATRLGKGTGLS